jgi:acetyltransferase-like isoleucine patch superfamily enzyme
MRAAVLRGIQAVDRVRFAAFRLRHGHALRAEDGVSANLRFATLRLQPGSELRVARGFATERQPGNLIRLGIGARVRIGPGVWLRTEHGENRICAFPGASIEIGADTLLNGAMLHAKREIRIGRDGRIGFGARLLDADFHDLDRETAERCAPILVGERVWIGANALVLRGVSIGDDVVVAAGSVVTRDVPPRCLVAGNPARPVRTIASREGCR